MKRSLILVCSLLWAMSAGSAVAQIIPPGGSMFNPPPPQVPPPPKIYVPAIPKMDALPIGPSVRSSPGSRSAIA